MGLYLNSIAPYDRYKTVSEDFYFVDKSALIEELIPALGREQRFFCIVRPRRFGKTVMANMVAAFFGKAKDSSGIFGHLAISGSSQYAKHLNQHDVIYLDCSEIPKGCCSYQHYISRLEDGISHDLLEAYPELGLDREKALWDLLSLIFEKTEQKFLFVIDEWDAPFHMPFLTDAEKQEYLLFLKSLLKGKSYAELAYMTGILPIAKYAEGSELNMFLEYDMATKIRFGEYFGFSETEVAQLHHIYQAMNPAAAISKEDLKAWYDGYCTAGGGRLYNPRSIVSALADNQLANYWTSSGAYDSIFYYLKHNIADVLDDIALMVSGERVEARMQEYAATSAELVTKDQIYSAMVIYGLLTYEDGEVFIPNKELMLKFEELLYSKQSLGYVYRFAKESSKMLKATLDGDTETMAKTLQYLHNTESPILSYNNETELSAVVNLAYLAARDKYRVEREDKAGKGFVDFIFYPYKANQDGIILELKVGRHPKEAIQQIKDKGYALRFQGKLGERPRYSGRVLAVGIGYCKETKEHSCCVEWLEGE
ncbi:MAG: AAA family ATPase [Lachnospiraceae bacterium]|jgi:hypothetical protein|nr:AAA family ATPase [Lachnospiraceae bacterium]